MLSALPKLQVLTWGEVSPWGSFLNDPFNRKLLSEATIPDKALANFLECIVAFLWKD